MLARGLTTDTRVGQAESNLLTTKDLLVRPVVPRFLVAGDHVQLAAIVQNNTRTDLDVSVSLQANGVMLDDPASISRQVTVPAGGRERLEWWGRVEDVPSVDLVFSAVSGELNDAARPANGALPVLRYVAPQTFSTAGQLDEAGERLELVSLPRSFDPAGGQLQVELAPSLAASMFTALDVLEHYPYACTEQTISRFLPNLETYRVLQEFGMDSPDLEAPAWTAPCKMVCKPACYAEPGRRLGLVDWRRERCLYLSLRALWPEPRPGGGGFGGR